MAPEKITGDFNVIDIEDGWETPEGYPPTVGAKILSGGLDEVNRTGHCTLLMRYLPGTVDTRVLSHDFFEEVWFIDGEMDWLDADDGVVQHIPKNSYVCRPPHVPHGPFRSLTGCLILVSFYYADDGK